MSKDGEKKKGTNNTAIWKRAGRWIKTRNWDRAASWIKTVIWIALICILFYFLSLLFNCVDWLSYESKGWHNAVFRYGQTVGALIAAVLVVNELKREADAKERESRIQQSTFIKDFNQAFITNPDMMLVERMLEGYYGDFRTYIDKNEGNAPPGENWEQTKQLETLFGKPGTDSRQRLINYLVYLEGLATVISNGAMEIRNVDSLLGYRFFIAVNNPAVQKLELIPFENEYREIHKLGRAWVKERKDAYEKCKNEPGEEKTIYGDYMIPMQKEGFSFKNV